MSNKHYPDPEKTPILLAPRKRKELLEKGLELFNNEAFFEAHEVWEELWHYEKGLDKTFVQALIVVAGHFVSIGKQNFSGAKSLALLAKEKFQLPPTDFLYKCIDIEPLLFAMHYNLGVLDQESNPDWGRFVIPKLVLENA